MSQDCPNCGGSTDDFGRALPAPQVDGYRNPALAVDAACTRTMGSNSGQDHIEVLMITRKLPPGEGLLALPGGFVEYGEDPENAVIRELAEETNVEGVIGPILCARGDPARDPRKHIVSIVYRVEVSFDAELVAGDDADDVGWFNLSELIKQPERVAFDHQQILAILANEIE